MKVYIPLSLYEKIVGPTPKRGTLLVTSNELIRQYVFSDKEVAFIPKSIIEMPLSIPTLGIDTKKGWKECYEFPSIEVSDEEIQTIREWADEENLPIFTEDEICSLLREFARKTKREENWLKEAVEEEFCSLRAKSMYLKEIAKTIRKG